MTTKMKTDTADDNWNKTTTLFIFEGVHMLVNAANIERETQKRNSWRIVGRKGAGGSMVVGKNRVDLDDGAADEDGKVGDDEEDETGRGGREGEGEGEGGVGRWGEDNVIAPHGVIFRDGSSASLL